MQNNNSKRSKTNNKSRRKRPKSKQQQPKQQPVTNTVNPYLNNLLRGAAFHTSNMLIPGSGPLAALATDQAHKLVKSVTGWGDYTIKSNTMVNDSVPIFNPDKRTFRFKNREYLKDIVGGVQNTFSLSYSQNINPGNPLMFPWLSSIAENFEEYKIHGMLFNFKTTSVDALNSTNTALGVVIMGTQYNPLNAPFSTKQEMENHEFSNSTKPSCSAIHPIECAPNQTPLEHLYVRNSSSLQVIDDPRFYDFGVTSVAVSGMQQTGVIVGELWVTYDIEFFKPRQQPVITYPLEILSGDSTTTAGTLFGNVPIVFNPLPGVTVLPYGFSFDKHLAGRFLINYSAKASTVNYFLPPTTTGLVSVDYFNSSGNNSGGTNAGLAFTALVTVTGAGTVQFTCNAAWAGLSSFTTLNNVTGLLPL